MRKVSRTQPIKRKPARGQAGISFWRVLLVVFLLFACLALAAAAGAAVALPALAAQEFGPPAPGLSFTQRVLYSYRLLANRNSLLTPLEPGAEARPFIVGLGESVNSIATRLEEERLITNADAFRTFLVYTGLDTGVQAGKYQLSPAMTTVEIAHALQDPLPGAVEFHILPGWRVEEIAEALPASGIEVSPVDFMTLVSDPPDNLLPAGVEYLDSLEGYLMPGAYTVERAISVEELVSLFVRRFDESVTAEMRAGFANQGLTLEQAVTLASIVQREAMIEEEQPIIASVFYNRLANGMKLDSDPTVQYALGYDHSGRTWWKNPLTAADLQVNSRYNTYLHPGLPPGPIANPGLPALRAVAAPATTPYFYFRALCDGSGRHSFAVSYEEHLNNACP